MLNRLCIEETEAKASRRPAFYLVRPIRQLLGKKAAPPEGAVSVM